MLLISFLLAATSPAEVRIEVEEWNGHLQMTLSGTANTAGLTPETRSGTAFLGASGWVLGLPPASNPVDNLQSYQAITLDIFPSGDIMTAAPVGLLGNWLREPTLSYSATANPAGFFYGDNFETTDPTDTFGELYLPANYISGAALSGSLILSNQTLATFGLTLGDTHTFGWNNGQDTLTFEVIPEPAVYGLVLLSSGALFGIRRIKFSPRFYRDRENDRIPHEPPGSVRKSVAPIMKIWLLILISLLAPTLYAGHGLCNNSGGFRLAKTYIENNSEVYLELTPELLTKLNSGEALSDIELEVFEDAYHQVAARRFELLTEEFDAINSTLEKSGKLNIVCSDRAEALFRSMVLGESPTTATEIAFNARDYQTRLVNQAAGGEEKTDKIAFDIVINTLANSSVERATINGRQLSSEAIETIRHQATRADTYSYRKTFKFFKKILPPEDYEAVTHPRSPETIYKSLPDLEVGEGGTLGYELNYIFKDAQYPSEGHMIFFQKISPDKIFMFDSLMKWGELVPIANQEASFEEVMKKGVKDLYNEYYEELKQAEALPINTPNRDTIIQSNKDIIRNSFSFFHDGFIDGDASIEIQNVYAQSYVPK